MIKENITLPTIPDGITPEIRQFMEDVLMTIEQLNTDLYNSVPVGFVYVQFPNTSSPADFLAGKWDNVTSTYSAYGVVTDGCS